MRLAAAGLAASSPVRLAITAVVLVAGCSSSPPASTSSDGVSMERPPAGWAPAAQPAAPASASDAAPPPAAAPSDRAGTWSSPSCGARGYERILELRANGTFTATDRVSPCPPGARCVWSGIVIREGTWTASGGHLALTVTKDAKGPTGQALPDSLTIDGGTLVEDAAGARCPFTRR